MAFQFVCLFLTQRPMNRGPFLLVAQCLQSRSLWGNVKSRTRIIKSFGDQGLGLGGTQYNSYSLAYSPIHLFPPPSSPPPSHPRPLSDPPHLPLTSSRGGGGGGKGKKSQPSQASRQAAKQGNYRGVSSSSFLFLTFFFLSFFSFLLLFLSRYVDRTGREW